MSFMWPWALLALLAVPIVLGIAWWLRRRRRKAAVRVSSIALVRAAADGRRRWVRLIPAALLIAGLVVLGVAAARPQASVPVASDDTNVILAIDESGSMCSTDVPPNRITVAEQAATAFVKAEAGRMRIGLVAFSGIAALLVPPTTDTQKLETAITTLTTNRGTAIGQGIITSIDGIASVDPSVPPSAATVTGKPVQHSADAIVVLTDGANTQGIDPADAAKEAAARGIRVYTIGFGTTTPAPIVCDPSQVGNDTFGQGFGGFGGFGGGGRNVQEINEAALKQVASTTGGKYFRAQNADELNSALGGLPRTFSVVTEDVDIAAWFALGGGVLVAAAVALSLWFTRVRRRRPPPPPVVE